MDNLFLYFFLVFLCKKFKMTGFRITGFVCIIKVPTGNSKGRPSSYHYLHTHLWNVERVNAHSACILIYAVCYKTGMRQREQERERHCIQKKNKIQCTDTLLLHYVTKNRMLIRCIYYCSCQSTCLTCIHTTSWCVCVCVCVVRVRARVCVCVLVI